MSVQQAQKVLGRKLNISGDASGDEAACSQASRPDGKKVWYMFQNYRVVRIDVGQKGFTTPEGAGVDSTEAQIRKMYGGKAKFSPHPYLDDEGHYVTVDFPGRRLIFETYHGKVTTFRVGLPGPAGYIEGCA